MVFAKDDDVISTFAPNASVQPFDIGVLPRAPIGRHDFFDSHRFYAPSKPIPIDAIAIPQNVFWCSIPRKGFDNLLRRPFCGRVLGYVEVNDLTPGMAQYDEYEQLAKSDREHD